MHASAFEFMRRMAWSLPPLLRVLEFGSRQVNGSIREIFTAADLYIGVDVQEGPGVELVGDAATIDVRDYADPAFNAVACAEVLEHTASGAEICWNAWRHLDAGGIFLVTCAGPGRPPHSCDGGPLQPGEFYRGIDQQQMRQWLDAAGFGFALVDGHSTPGDTYAVAVRF